MMTLRSEIVFSAICRSERRGFAAYYKRLVDLCGAQSAKDLKVVYTPLHGTGLRTVENVFPAAGIGNLFIVEEQKSPDGSFPTVKSPNPEDPGAMAMAVWQCGLRKITGRAFAPMRRASCRTWSFPRPTPLN
jgi:hypothetical protein